MTLARYPHIICLLPALLGTALLVRPLPIAVPSSPRVDGTYRRASRDGMRVLHAWYDPDRGLWKSTGWWNSANSLELVVHYSAVAGDNSYLADIATTFDRNQAGRFLNNYYDDEGWWALTWIEAYDLTHDARYLSAARTIFDDMKAGWDDHCGGGIWWSKDKKYKNAIANSLFLTLAARLHKRVRADSGADSYGEWAVRAYTWFHASGMVDAESLVNDGLNASCVNNGGTTWTYNQGSWIGALVAMRDAFGQNSYVTEATRVADAAVKALVNENVILREPCEKNDGCGSDGPQFKGIFIRNLALLYEATRRSAYRDFILRNADSILAHDRSDAGEFGLKWAGPFDHADAARQSSALCAIVAADKIFSSSNSVRSTADP